jgi:hypothetical protein
MDAVGTSSVPEDLGHYLHKILLLNSSNSTKAAMNPSQLIKPEFK